jgi:hypothetical protein
MRIANRLLGGGTLLLALSLGGCYSSRTNPPRVTAVRTSSQSQAGFRELESIPFSFQQTGLGTLAYASTRARVWHAYFPATGMAPKDAPLFVFLNGGPGCATTSNLFSMNTAPYTLDREHQQSPGSQLSKNPHSWTAIGNLLYIDAPMTGFSYNLMPNPDVTLKRQAEFDVQNQNPFIDAAQVIRVLLRFLDEHSDIRNNPVVLVGESYGGTRVSTMLNLLLFHEQYGTGVKVYKDATLAAEIKTFFNQGLATGTASVAPEIVARQFGRQVLIQPQLTGDFQNQEAATLYYQDGSIIDQISREAWGLPFLRVGNVDKFTYVTFIVLPFCRRDRYIYTKWAVSPIYAWSDALENFALQSLTSVSAMNTLLGGQDVRDIPGFRKEQRTEAYRYHTGGSSMTATAGEDLSEWAKTWIETEEQSNLYQAALLGAQGAGSFEAEFGKPDYWDAHLDTTNAYIFKRFMSNQATAKGYLVSPDKSPLYGNMFLENISLVSTLLTDAELDLVIYSPALPKALQRHTSIVKSVTAVRGSQTPLQTHGTFQVNYVPGSLAPLATPASVTLHYPYYPTSGHSVSSAQPDKLLLDVRNWMAP